MQSILACGRDTYAHVLYTVLTSSLCLGGPAERGNKGRLPDPPVLLCISSSGTPELNFPHNLVGKIVSDMAWCLAESFSGHLEPPLYDLSII